MTATSLATVAVTLAVVFGLLGVTLRLLRRLTMGPGLRGRAPLQMAVVQRLALGPRQGIAVVRIGERLLAVSLGEGGVRPLLELDPDGAQGPAEAPAAGAAPARQRAHPRPLPAFACAGEHELDAESVPARCDHSSRGGAPAPGAALWRTTVAPPGALQAPAFGPARLRAPALRAALLRTARAVAARLPAPHVGRWSAACAALGALVLDVGAGIVHVVRTSLRSIGLTLVLALALALASSALAQAPAAAPATAPGRIPPLAREHLGRAEAQVAHADSVAARADSMVARLAPQLDLRVGGPDAGGLRLSGSVGVVVMMGLLTLLPTLLLLMTSFTRILVVLHFLRQAIGAAGTPPAQLVAALALILTGFVMAPTLREANRTAIEPWMAGRMEQGEMLRVGVRPFRAFMARQTRDRDLETFVEMSRMAPPATADDVPLVVLMSAFVTSELRTAFQIGFALFLPFIVIDLVVSSVLMSMGMFMLPPAMISLPFKLLLFVLADGWNLVVQGLVASFR